MNEEQLVHHLYDALIETYAALPRVTTMDEEELMDVLDKAKVALDEYKDIHGK